jgi:hypothetical protein
MRNHSESRKFEKKEQGDDVCRTTQLMFLDIFNHYKA